MFSFNPKLRCTKAQELKWNYKFAKLCNMAAATTPIVTWLSSWCLFHQNPSQNFDTELCVILSVFTNHGSPLRTLKKGHTDYGTSQESNLPGNSKRTDSASGNLASAS